MVRADILEKLVVVGKSLQFYRIENLNVAKKTSQFLTGVLDGIVDKGLNPE